MSESEGRKSGLDTPKLDELERAVRRALRQLEVWRERAVASEAERRRLQELVDRLDQEEGDPDDLVSELKRLRSENEKLRDRLMKGLEQAEELAREVEFLEDSR